MFAYEDHPGINDAAPAAEEADKKSNWSQPQIHWPIHRWCSNLSLELNAAPKPGLGTTLLCPKILNWLFEHHNIEYNTKFSWAKWHVYVFAFLVVVVVICLPSMFFHCHTYVAQSFPSQCVLQEIPSLKNNFCYHPCKGLNFRFSRKIGWSWFKLQVLVENLQSQTWQAYICWGYVFVNCIFVRKNPCFVYLWIAYLKEIDGEKLYLLIYVACIGGGGRGGAWVWRILKRCFIRSYPCTNQRYHKRRIWEYSKSFSY